MSGGSLQSLTLNGRYFTVTVDTEVIRGLGGYTNEILMNGDGTTRNIQTLSPWKLDGINVVVDDDNLDQEFLQGLMNLKSEFPITATYTGNVTYQGTGQITGDNDYSNQTSSATITLMGSRNLTQQ